VLPWRFVEHGIYLRIMPPADLRDYRAAERTPSSP